MPSVVPAKSFHPELCFSPTLSLALFIIYSICKALVHFIFYVESLFWAYLEDFLHWTGISCNTVNENTDASACRFCWKRGYGLPPGLSWDEESLIEPVLGDLEATSVSTPSRKC